MRIDAPPEQRKAAFELLGTLVRANAAAIEASCLKADSTFSARMRAITAKEIITQARCACVAWRS